MNPERVPLIPSDSATTTTLNQNHNNPIQDYGSRYSNEEACIGGAHGDAGVSVNVPRKSLLKVVAIVLPMLCGIFLFAMDGTMIVSSYTAIGSEFKQLQKTSWIATIDMLALASFQPLYGKLSDIFGRKTCLLFAYCVFAFGCLLCGLARSMNELLIARAFCGMGGGMTTMVTIIMSDIIPSRFRGTWQGLVNIVFGLGSATGASLGGFLADGIGWRWAFRIQVAATVIAILSVSLALKLPRDQGSNMHLRDKLKKVDFIGAFIFVLTIFSLLLGLDRGGRISWTDNWTLAALTAAVPLFVLFGFIETKRASEPFAPKTIVINHIAIYLAHFFGIASCASLFFHAPLYLQAVQRKSASETGLLLLPSIVGGAIGSLGGGVVIQATGKYYWLTVAAYAAMFIGGVGSIAVSTYLPGIITGLVVNKIGNGIGLTTTLIAIIANPGPDQAIATAVSYLFRSIGSVVGIAVGSSLVQDRLRQSLRQSLSGSNVDEIICRVVESLDYLDELDPTTRTAVRQSYGQAFQATMWLSAALATAAMICSLFIREKPLTKNW